MKKKIIGILICIFLILIGTGVLPIAGAIKNFEKVNISMNSTSMVTITVDDEGDGDFTSIQDAIDAAEDGDIIWVYSGTYIENVVVDKQLAIMGIGEELGIGDDVDKPSIDGGSGDVVHIYADSVNVSGFIIQNGYRCIYMEYSNNSTISGNTITVNYSDGIVLNGSSGNTITGNNITGNNLNSATGIHLYGSSDNTITGNNIDNIRFCIMLGGSSENTITGNNMDNIAFGIILDGSSDNNIITGNNITDMKREDGYGIVLDVSSGNTIKDNFFQSNGISIVGNNIEHWNSHIIENNIANGGQIRYYKNTNNVNVPSDTSQVILANCSHFTIQNLNLSYMNKGVQLGFSSGNTITGNNIDNNHRGIILYGSSDNTITGNNIDNNYWIGIGLTGSSGNNTITGNNIDNNYWNGIGLGSSGNNIITGNNITGNNAFGIVLDGSSGNTITGNNIDNNNHGIYLRSSSNNLLHQNNLIDNTQNAYDDSTNYWDKGSLGNYWDDYDDRYPDAQKKWLKGIWDTPYEIPEGNNQDRYPLIKPYGKPKSKTFTFIDFYKPLISSFPFLNKILNQIII